MDRPTAAELAAAVRAFLENEVLPTLDDPRLVFRTRVAMNALGIVEREASAFPPVDRTEEADLARRIRAGEIGLEALPAVQESVAQKLLISNPRYLERY